MTHHLQLKEDGSRVYSIAEGANRKGDIAEYYAVTWLWDNGYEVFKNAGCSGPVDMVAIKDGEVTLIDVKSTRTDNKRNRKTLKSVRTKEQENMGVVFVAFDPDTRKLHWVDHRK
mgnify:CR=1 FL=1